MKVKQDFTQAKAATPSVIGRIVSIFVPDDHPVMRLKQADGAFDNCALGQSHASGAYAKPPTSLTPDFLQTARRPERIQAASSSR